MNRTWFSLSIGMLAFAGTFVSCKEETSTGDRVALPEEQEQISTDIVENQTVITFERDLHDFGDIPQGEKVSTDFRFTNTGKNDLLITDAHGSCGCTVPEWPKEPIPPGGSGIIHVVFDSGKRSGQITKKVTVTANTIPNPNTLTIKGNVVTN